MFDAQRAYGVWPKQRLKTAENNLPCTMDLLSPPGVGRAHDQQAVGELDRRDARQRGTHRELPREGRPCRGRGLPPDNR